MTRSQKLGGVSVIVAVVVAAFGVVQAKYLPYVEGIDQDWGGVEQPFAIPKARGGMALEGNLNSPTDIDAFAYTFSEPVKAFPLQVDVPTCDGRSNAAFYPTVALVGPGLPAPETNVDLPFAVPKDMGVQIYTIERARVKRNSYADYGPELYVIGVRTQIEIPKASSYKLVVWEPGGHVGPYIITTGDQEPDFDRLPAIEIDRLFQKERYGLWVKDACDAIPAELSATPEVTAAP